VEPQLLVLFYGSWLWLVLHSFSGELHSMLALGHLTLPPGCTGSYTCPALRPYQLGPMCVPKCNRKVTGSGYKAVDSYEVVNRRL